MRLFTTMERTFRKRPDGLFQEFVLHFINTDDGHGNTTSKLEKSIRGGVFREEPDRAGMNGVVVWVDPEGVPRRLVGLRSGTF